MKETSYLIPLQESLKQVRNEDSPSTVAVSFPNNIFSLAFIGIKGSQTYQTIVVHVQYTYHIYTVSGFLHAPY